MRKRGTIHLGCFRAINYITTVWVSVAMHGFFKFYQDCTSLITITNRVSIHIPERKWRFYSGWSDLVLHFFPPHFLDLHLQYSLFVVFSCYDTYVYLIISAKK